MISCYFAELLLFLQPNMLYVLSKLFFNMLFALSKNELIMLFQESKTVSIYGCTFR